MSTARLSHVVVEPASMSGDGLGSSRASADGNLVTRTKDVAATARAVVVGENRQQTGARNKQSLDYIVRSGIAGGLAGCAAKTVVGPLDRVKILFQASSPQFAKYSGSWSGLVIALREIGRTEGARGLFRGHSATLLRVFPYAAIKFLAYEQFRAVIITRPEDETALRRLASGSLAGLTSTFFTYPLEMIRVRLAFETKKDSRSSLSRICAQIYNEHPSRLSRPGNGAELANALNAGSKGVAQLGAATLTATSQAVDQVVPRVGLANFYRGFSPTLLGILPYAGVSFMVHDVMGDFLRHPALLSYTTVPGRDDRNGRPRLTNVAELAAGAVAGMIGQTSAYPLEIIRRRMQVGGAIGDGHRLRMAETAAKIWAERGWRGFFVGLTIGYTKVVPMAAVGFWTYEKFKQLLGA